MANVTPPFGDIRNQYACPDLIGRILAELASRGKDTAALTRDDIAGLDEFHIGGRNETQDLARAAGLAGPVDVLDIGSGLGGPARTLATDFGCQVTGLEITPDYCEAAKVLSARVGGTEGISFVCGSALTAPLADAAFDAAWMQFVSMNIPDKEALVCEIRRVLRPGGRLILHEVFAGPGGDTVYPVFWANDASVNHLVPPERMRELLERSGFRPEVWNDCSEASLEWMQSSRARMHEPGPPPLGLNIVVPDRPGKKAANVIRNLTEKRIRVFRGVFTLNG